MFSLWSKHTFPFRGRNTRSDYEANTYPHLEAENTHSHLDAATHVLIMKKKPITIKTQKTHFPI